MKGAKLSGLVFSPTATQDRHEGACKASSALKMHSDSDGEGELQWSGWLTDDQYQLSGNGVSFGDRGLTSTAHQ